MGQEKGGPRSKGGPWATAAAVRVAAGLANQSLPLLLLHRPWPLLLKLPLAHALFQHQHQHQGELLQEAPPLGVLGASCWVWTWQGTWYWSEGKQEQFANQ